MFSGSTVTVNKKKSKSRKNCSKAEFEEQRCIGVVETGPKSLLDYPKNRCTRCSVIHPYTRSGKKLNTKYCQMHQHQANGIFKNRVCCPYCSKSFDPTKYKCVLMPKDQVDNFNNDDEVTENVEFGRKRKNKNSKK
jgi:hypothetical protein